MSNKNRPGNSNFSHKTSNEINWWTEIRSWWNNFWYLREFERNSLWNYFHSTSKVLVVNNCMKVHWISLVKCHFVRRQFSNLVQEKKFSWKIRLRTLERDDVISTNHEEEFQLGEKRKQNTCAFRAPKWIFFYRLFCCESDWKIIFFSRALIFPLIFLLYFHREHFQVKKSPHTNVNIDWMKRKGKFSVQRLRKDSKWIFFRFVCHEIIAFC